MADRPNQPPSQDSGQGTRRLHSRAPWHSVHRRSIHTTSYDRFRVHTNGNDAPVKARRVYDPVGARLAKKNRSHKTTRLDMQWTPPVYRKHKRSHSRRPLFVISSARRRRVGYSTKRGGYYSLSTVRKPRGLPRPVAWLLTLMGVLLVVQMSVGTLIGIAGWMGYDYVTRDLPSVDDIHTVEFQSTRIYDRYGNFLYEMYDPDEGKRVYVNIDQMPRSLIEATIAAEDKSFEDNLGVDLEGIVRAAYINLTNQGQSGGSTITQQVVRRVLLPEGDERTWMRKIREAIMAVRVTERYSKDKILEIYLNEIPYGSLSYGVAAAADTYFGKKVQDLTLAESAMLAGLPQAPGVFDPNINFEIARARQRIVLDLMVENKYITKDQADVAFAVDVHPIVRAANVPKAAPHFVEYVRQVLEQEFGPEVAYRGGLKVITTVDLNLQAEAQRITTQQIENLKKQGASNAAMVAVNPRTGEILAMVGSADYTNPIYGEVNVATSLRQPGSSFKPFTYATALQRGDFNPVTVIPDLPARFAGAAANLPYIPQNYDGRFHGPVTMRSALANSFNIPAVEVMDAVGVPAVLDTVHKMGITTLNDPTRYGLALTLGGGEVTLLDMTSAYGTFANYGYHVPVTPFLKIVDSKGKTLYELDRKRPEGEQVLEKGVAFQISSMLSDNAARSPMFGPNSALKIDGIEAAAKTGTTNDWKDSWTMGYTRALAVGVWVGNNDGRPMAHVAGAIGAAPIWHNFIETVYKSPDLKKVLLKPREAELPEKFYVPTGMVRRPVCAVSGMVPTSACLQVKYDWFTLNNAPVDECTWHRWMPVTLHDNGGAVAGAGVPHSDTIERVYTLPPAEYRNWIGGGPPGATLVISDAPGAPLPTPVLQEPPPVAEQASAPQGPGGPAGLRQTEPLDTQPIPDLHLGITSPSSGQVVNGLVQIMGEASSENFARYRLEVGPAGGPMSTIVESPVPPFFNVIAFWNTEGLASGPYTMRLTVETNDGQAARRDMTVRVGTGQPSIAITSPTDGSPVYENEAVTVDVRADGGGAEVKGVEIYVDGRRIASLTSAPYSARWAVISGTHEIGARMVTVTGEQMSAVPVRVSSGGLRPTPTPTLAPIMWISNLTLNKELQPGVHDVWVDIAPSSSVQHVDIYIDGFPAGYADNGGFRVNSKWTPTPTQVVPPPPTATMDPNAAATATVAQATAQVQETRVARAGATRTARADAAATKQAASANATAESAQATASVVLATVSPTPSLTAQPSATPTFVVHQKLMDPMLGDYIAHVRFNVGRHRITAIGYDRDNREVGRDETWVVVK